MAWPCRAVIRSVFENLSNGNQEEFFKHVADDVEWTVNSHTTMGGTYNSKQEFRDGTFGVLAAVINPDTPLRLKIQNVVGGSDQSWAVIEMVSDSKTNEGTKYDQTYAWVTRWKMLRNAPQGEIVEVRAYLDTALLDKVVAEKKG